MKLLAFIFLLLSSCFGRWLRAAFTASRPSFTSLVPRPVPLSLPCRFGLCFDELHLTRHFSSCFSNKRITVCCTFLQCVLSILISLDRSQNSWWCSAIHLEWYSQLHSFLPLLPQWLQSLLRDDARCDWTSFTFINQYQKNTKNKNIFTLDYQTWVVSSWISHSLPAAPSSPLWS